MQNVYQMTKVDVFVDFNKNKTEGSGTIFIFLISNNYHTPSIDRS